MPAAGSATQPDRLAGDVGAVHLSLVRGHLTGGQPLATSEMTRSSTRSARRCRLRTSFGSKCYDAVAWSCRPAYWQPPSPSYSPRIAMRVAPSTVAIPTFLVGLPLVRTAITKSRSDPQIRPMLLIPQMFWTTIHPFLRATR